MLNIFSPLYFPKLVHVGEANFKAWSDDSKVTALYRLDWSLAEKIKEKEFGKWLERAHVDAKYVGDLPKEYDEWLKNFTFAIPNHYITRIRTFARMGLEGWTTAYPFDTNIREICLKPAISAVEVSFKLIADCPYDKETNYFYRGDDKIIVAHAALYKFWCFQTGRGCIEDHANFQRLEFISKYEDIYNGTPKEPSKMKKEVNKFLEAIKKHNKVLDDAHIITEGPPVIGPSLGEK
jgi:hypothetical protein